MNSSAIRSPTHEDAAAREAVDEREQPLLALGLAGQAGEPIGLSAFQISNSDVSSDSVSDPAQPRRRQIIHHGVGGEVAGGRVLLGGAAPVRTRMPRAPTARPSADIQPLVADHERSRPDRGRDRARRGRSAAVRACGSRSAARTPPRCRPDGADNSNTRRRARRRRPAAPRAGGASRRRTLRRTSRARSPTDW